jgi:hypothetical protein
LKRYPFARLQGGGQKIQGTSENPGGFPDVPRKARFFAAFPDWSRKKCAQILNQAGR